MRSRPDIASGLTWYRRRPWRSPEELVAFQAERMRRLVEHAYHNVPYYRRHLDRHHVDPRDIQRKEDLARIPTTSKRDLQSLPLADLIAKPFLNRKRLIPAVTSGSIGQPFTVWRTWFEQNLQHLFRLRAHHYFGVRARDRVANVRSVKAPSPDDNKMVGTMLRRLGMYRRIYVSTLLEPDEIMAILSKYQPDVLVSYPSTVARLAMQLADGKWSVRPRLLIAGAELMTSEVKAKVSTAFQAPVFNVYGCNEFNLVAWECAETGELHTCDDSLIVEVIEDGRPVGPGETGHVVVTSLHSYAMPFIRFELGDVAKRGSDRCSCGASFATLRQLRGRVADYFRLPGGRLVHPFDIYDQLVAARSWIGQHQLVQEREDSIRLLVVPLGTVPPGEIETVAESIATLLGANVSFRVELVNRIELDATGKMPLTRISRTPANDGSAADQTQTVPPSDR